MKGMRALLIEEMHEISLIQVIAQASIYLVLSQDYDTGTVTEAPRLDVIVTNTGEGLIETRAWNRPLPSEVIAIVSTSGSVA